VLSEAIPQQFVTDTSPGLVTSKDTDSTQAGKVVVVVVVDVVVVVVVVVTGQLTRFPPDTATFK
jgi:hypothetical protein